MEVSSTNLMASLGSMVFLGDDRLGKETRRLGSLSLVCSMIQPCIFYRYQYNRVYICIMRVDVARKTTASSSQGSVMVPCLFIAAHPRGHLYSGFPEAVKADQSLRQVDINYMNCHNAIMASVPVFLANTPVVRIGS